jgi:hypothetical protein
MEPISTLLATALALGAAAGLKNTTDQAVRDAYAGLKTLIQSRYTKVNLGQLEEAPTSKARRAMIEEDLAEAGVAQDEEVLRQARDLIDLIRVHTPEAAGAIGVDLEEIKGASLRISDVIASGTGVRAKHAEMAGKIEISSVRAGYRGDDPAKKS